MPAFFQQTHLLCRWLFSKYGRVQHKETGEFRQLAVYTSAPIECDQKQFLEMLLDALGCPYWQKGRNGLFRQVIQLLRHLGVRLLIIDEFQQLLDGTPRQQRGILTMIKMITNMAGVSIVGAGLETAINALYHDEQLLNRLQPIHLPLWTTKDEGINEYRSMLKTFEDWLPLRQKSNLSNLAMARRINEMTKGLLGEITTLLKRSAIYAVETGEEFISLRTCLKTINQC